jgi:hypothetical protein
MLPEIARSKVEVVINHIHFGTITQREYTELLIRLKVSYDHAIYLSGNPDVIANFQRRMIPCRFVERSNDDIYTGTEIRKQLGDGASAEKFGLQEASLKDINSQLKKRAG